MRLEMPNWSIDISPGWTTVIREDQEVLRLFLDAVVQNEENFQKVDSSGIALGVQRIRARPQTIENYADAEMRRIRFSSRRVGGQDVRVYDWGNGVQKLVTVFVEIPDSASLCLLRFDVVIACSPSGSPVPGRDAAIRVIDSLAWR
jgi:hypothetical protein